VKNICNIFVYLAVLIMVEEVSLSRNVNICNTQHNVMHLYPKSVCEVLRINNILPKGVVGTST